MDYFDQEAELNRAIAMYKTRTRITYFLYGAYVVLVTYSLYVLAMQLAGPVSSQSARLYSPEIAGFLGLVNIFMPFSVPLLGNFIMKKPKMKITALMAGRNGKVVRVNRRQPRKCRIRIFGFTFPGEASHPVSPGEEIVVASASLNRKGGLVKVIVKDPSQ